MVAHTPGSVRSRVQTCFVIAALIISIGGHWALLQSVAWVGMFSKNIRTCSVTEALEKTFDGKHPCALCKVVADGKKSEQKQPLTKLEVKIDFWLAPAGCSVIAPPRFGHTLPLADAFSSRVESPPTPPPRLV